jgi:small subunit ribosomal protein S4
MGRYTGPKVRKSRRLHAPLADTTKHMKADLEVGPGQHGARRRGKVTLYGERLREKQKLCWYYHIGDAQFRRYMDEAARVPENTTNKLNELLERRLDNVIRRAAFSRTIWQARQLVVHGHVRVNGRKVDRPSYGVEVGDVITFRDKSKAAVKVMADAVDSGAIVPSWLEVNKDELTVKVGRLPDMAETFRPFEADLLKVIEFRR